MKTQFRILVLLWCSIALVQPIAAQANSSQSSATLTHCSEGSPDFFAPSISTTSTSHDAMRPIYNRLVRHLRGSTRLVPSLAEHWDISRDGLEYIFYLQQGVQWHSNPDFQPTRHFNADDVIFMIERQWKPDHPFHRVSSANHAFFRSAGLEKLIKSVDKIDNYTVRIRLHEANASFLFNFALGFMGVQSHEYAMAMLKQGRPGLLDTAPIGTGPFTFVGYEVDKRIRYRVFHDYWEGRAQIRDLEFLIVPNAADRWKKIQSGECHVMAFPNTNDLKAMQAHPEVSVLQMPGVNVSYWAFNLRKPPFNDVRVRKALSMAINRAALLEQVYQGTAVKAVSLIPPTMWSHNESLVDDPYDPQAARELLAEAGYPDGFSTDLWAMSTARGYNPNPALTAQLIQADLAKIGVKAEIKTVPWAEYSRRMRNGEHETGLLGWTGSHGDPDYFFFNLLTCQTADNGGANVSKFCNQAYDDLVIQARRIANPAQRIPLYEEAQRIFKQQAPWLPLSHSTQTWVHRNEVRNFRISPFGGLDFYGVELK